MTSGRRVSAAFAGLAALVAAFGLIHAGTKLPSPVERAESTAVSAGDETRIGRSVTPQLAAHAGLSGIYALPGARDAFAARMLLAERADKSLDVQYYIWRADMSGCLLLDALSRAADRGVRVRLLLDDHNTAGLDEMLADLDAHPRVEVRLFNPAGLRRMRWLAYLTDFRRMNRRMHNKSFTADGQVTIIGGRNVGDEYFDNSQDLAFADLDVMAIGPVVHDVSSDFDRYWASESSYPAEVLLPRGNLAELKSKLWDIKRDASAAAYHEATRNSSYVRRLLQGELEVEWAVTRMVSDDPAKVLERSHPDTNLFAQLKQILGQPEIELQLVSPYFVPTAAGVQWFAAAARRGVRITVLTNALDATDVAAVHAGYAKRRKPLLEAGIALYESRRQRGGNRTASEGGGSSDTSLHAKTFAVDGSRVFVGSFNFDPRSAHLNTELGFVIDSPAMAREIGAAFEREIPMNAYEVRLSDSGKLYWLYRHGERVLATDTEPGTSLWQRAAVELMSVLPIERLL
jgi:putative cardiolipin synthase